MHPMLTIAIRAVRKAASLVTQYYENSQPVEISKKTECNFMDQVNYDIGRLIVETLSKSYPNHTIFCKALKTIDRKQDIQWLVSPLDGEDNFIRGFPHFSISITVFFKQRSELGVVYDPIKNELFTAIRGQGSQLNGYRLRCNQSKNINKYLLATESYLQKNQSTKHFLNISNILFDKGINFRCTGSATLDLVYVAAGRIDGFLDIALSPWVFSAGALIIKEAGGVITDFLGGHDYEKSGNLVAGNPQVVKDILIQLYEGKQRIQSPSQ